SLLLIPPTDFVAVAKHQLAKPQISIAADALRHLLRVPDERLPRAWQPAASRQPRDRRYAGPRLDREASREREAECRSPAARRLRREQRRDPGVCRRFRNLRREIAARHGSHPNLGAQNLFEDLAAARPFVDELRPGAVAHAQRMRARVAADNVSAPRELTDVVPADEPARANEVRGDEEMPREPARVEEIDRAHRARAAIVEGEHGAGRAWQVWQAR